MELKLFFFLVWTHHHHHHLSIYEIYMRQDLLANIAIIFETIAYYRDLGKRLNMTMLMVMKFISWEIRVFYCSTFSSFFTENSCRRRNYFWIVWDWLTGGELKRNLNQTSSEFFGQKIKNKSNEILDNKIITINLAGNKWRNII